MGSYQGDSYYSSMFGVCCKVYGLGGKTELYGMFLTRQDTPRATHFDDRESRGMRARVPSTEANAPECVKPFETTQV